MVKIKNNISNTRKYRHSLMSTNSTTCNFKDVQPLFCRLLMADASIDLNLNSFARLAPLVYPCFGQMKSRYLAKYIPLEQIFPQYATFLSGLPVNTTDFSGIYTAVPQISQYALWKILTFTDTDSTNAFAIATQFANVTNSSPIVDDNGVQPRDLQRMGLQEYIDRFRSDVSTYLENHEIDDTMFIINSNYDDDGNVIDRYQCIDTALLTAACEVLKNGSDVASVAEKYNVPFMTGNIGASDDKLTEFEQAYNSADYVSFYQSSTGSTSDVTRATCYRLTERGRMLRKIFIGLGYQPSENNHTNTSLLPIFAFYKAYFDAFYPKRLSNFADSFCYQTIDLLQRLSAVTNGDYLFKFVGYPSTQPLPYDNASTSAQTAFQNVVRSFTAFIHSELSRCYSTHDMDFFSVQTSSIDGNANNTFSNDVTFSNNTNDLVFGNLLVGADGTDSYISQTGSIIGTNAKGNVAQLAINNSSSQPSVFRDTLNKWSLQMIQRLQNYVTRSSLLGRNVERFVRSHFNSDVYNELYLSSRSVGSAQLDVDISDVTATADTAQTSENGSVGDYLGAYGGKGIGSTGLNVKFKADTMGYLIILQWLEVESGYYFGTDPQLHYQGKFDIPNSEWDALGYEITPRSCIWTDNGISFEQASSGNARIDDVSISNKNGFGFIPRYSRFKTSHNVINGDFSRHALLGDLSAFYLDRQVITRYVDFNDVGGSGSAKYLKPTLRKLPIASSDWQFNSRYDWLGNYNRIFYNSGNVYTNIDDAQALNSQYDFKLYGLEDNVLLHNVLRWKEVNSLKPLSDSYETEVGDNNSTYAATPA